MVAGRLQPGGRGLVGGVWGGARESAHACGGAVCGLCDVAARMAGRGEAGRRTRLLEGAAGRYPGAAGVARGQTAAVDADLWGGGLPCEADRGSSGGIEAIKPE